MKQYLASGWHLTRRHTKITVLLFLYQAIWSFLLYRSVQGMVTSTLKRYPEVTGSSEATTLFWIENQFLLMKTDFIKPYLISFFVLLAVRMIITPFIQSGLYHSIYAQATGKGGTSFRDGIKHYWKPVITLYWIKNALLLTPLFWIIKPLWQAFMSNPSIYSVISIIDWKTMIYICWAVLIYIGFYIMQLGAASSIGIRPILKQAGKQMLHFLLLTVVIILIGAAIQTSLNLVAFTWASLLALVTYQLIPLIRTMLQIWLISSQYSCLIPKS